MATQEEKAFVAGEIENLVEEIYEKLDEIRELLKQVGGGLADRAEMYWLAHIDGALENRGFHLGGSFISLKDTLEELRGEDE